VADGAKNVSRHLAITVRLECSKDIGDEWGATGRALGMDQFTVEEKRKFIVGRRREDEGVNRLIEAGE
jgi:hypothetical protein